MCLKSIFFLIILVLSQGLGSQNQNSKWYFGNKAALDFIAGQPISINTNTMISSEGSCSIADDCGNLLFYSDGATVWNRQHTIMNNGSGLAGSQTSSQAGIVVRKPGNRTIYYLFTPTSAASSGGLCYSEIDMSLAAGMGSVTAKNVLLHSPTCEKITGVRHCNGADVWVITHDYNTDVFRANRVSNAGVNAIAVVSAIGPTYTGGSWSGVMKVSPSGKRIAIAHPVSSGSSAFELYDFDNVSGIVTNSLNLGTVGGSPYGCEFSPDGSKLYGGAGGASSFYQWDLCAGSNAAILASKTIVGSGTNVSSMQLAIDGKIYLAIAASQSLGVIHNPNNPAANCNYIHNSQSIAPNTGFQGLPNFLASSLRTPFTFTNAFACNTLSYTTSYTTTSAICPAAVDPINAVEWIFGDPGSGAANTSTLAQPVHQYPASGSYTVKLVIYSGPCAADTLVQCIIIPPSPSISVSGNYTICPGVSASITATGANSYSWTNVSGSSSIVVNPSVPTTYTVTGTYTNTGCRSTKTVAVVPATCLSIKDGNNDQSFGKIYPNPFKNSFIVETKTPGTIYIYNQLGVLLTTIQTENGRQTIDAAGYARGVYALHFKTGEQHFYTKIIKTD